MKKYFIEKTDKRYSIREDGNVVSHYRYYKSGKRYHDKLIKVTDRCDYKRKAYVSIAFLHTRRSIPVHSLMIKYFRLKPPDIFHTYVLDNIDGDLFNNNLNNLYWKIYTIGNNKYQPMCFYKRNKIVEKRCSNCGNIKDISNYSFTKERWGNRTLDRYSNTCYKCKYEKVKHSRNSNNKVMERYKKSCVVDLKRRRHNLHECYINEIIKNRGLNPSTFTPEMKNVIRETLKIKRYIKDEAK